MSLVTTYHAATDAVLATTGLTDKEAHLHAGLAIYVGAQLVLRSRHASLEALLLVVALEALNEAFDAVFFGRMRWGDTIGDVGATIFWPLILFALSRYRRWRWSRQESPNEPEKRVSRDGRTGEPKRQRSEAMARQG